MFLLTENGKNYFIENSKDLLCIRGILQKNNNSEKVFLIDKFLNKLDCSSNLKEINGDIIEKQEISLDNLIFRVKDISYICDSIKVTNIIIKYNDCFYKCSKINIVNIKKYINYLEKEIIVDYNYDFCNLDKHDNLNSFVYLVSDKTNDINKLEDIFTFDFKLLTNII